MLHFLAVTFTIYPKKVVALQKFLPPKIHHQKGLLPVFKPENPTIETTVAPLQETNKHVYIR